MNGMKHVRKTALSGLLMLACACLYAQNYAYVIDSVDMHNTTIKALQRAAEASKTEAANSVRLSDPRLGAGYLLGSPKGEGNRFDLSLTQEFDFPTVYAWKKRIARGESSIAYFRLHAERKKILLEAAEICIDIIYYNALDLELYRNLGNARSIADAVQEKFDKGIAGQLDLNKAKLNLISATKAYQSNLVERQSSLLELARLNAGRAVELEVCEYEPTILPEDFEVWYKSVEENNPELQALKLERQQAEDAVKLAKAEWLPSFSVGYESEFINGTSLQGVAVGLRVPLWEKRGSVRTAKAKLTAAKSMEQSAFNTFYSQLKTAYNRALSLQKINREYITLLEGISGTDILKKALDKGEIDLIDYYTELSIWYDAYVEILASARDFNKEALRLNQWNYALGFLPALTESNL